MPIAVFRADASQQIGAGHIMRCLVLADALADAGWRTVFACRQETTAVVPALIRSSHQILPVAAEQDEACVLVERLEGKTDLLVVDHYGRDAAFESALRGKVRRIMVIDDVANREHDCDLLLDTSLGRQAEDYAGLVPASCRLLIGPTFALLRPQFEAARSVALARRRLGGPVARILISLGGTDPNRLMECVVQGVMASGIEAAVDVVTGLVPAPSIDLAREAAPPGQSYRLLGGVEDMAGLMLEADLAVGAGGVTTWERCCLGLPTVLIITADNQLTQARAVTEAGAALGLGWHGDITAESIAAAVRRLSQQPSLMKKISEAAARLCDGAGCGRVVDEIKKLTGT